MSFIPMYDSEKIDRKISAEYLYWRLDVLVEYFIKSRGNANQEGVYNALGLEKHTNVDSKINAQMEELIKHANNVARVETTSFVSKIWDKLCQFFKSFFGKDRASLVENTIRSYKQEKLSTEIISSEEYENKQLDKFLEQNKPSTGTKGWYICQINESLEKVHENLAQLKQTAYPQPDHAQIKTREDFQKWLQSKPKANSETIKQVRDEIIEKDSLYAGKWVITCDNNDVDTIWDNIAKACFAGKLGPVAKVSGYNPNSIHSGHAICVYTEDFRDINEVARVYQEIINTLDGQKYNIKGYKQEINTLLGIESFRVEHKDDGKTSEKIEDGKTYATSSGITFEIEGNLEEMLYTAEDAKQQLQHNERERPSA